MGTRTVALLAALATVPSVAFAHEHPMECLVAGGKSTEGYLVLSGSCGVSAPEVKGGAGFGDQGHPHDGEDIDQARPPRRWYLVMPEVLRFGRSDDGRGIQRWVATLGARYNFVVGRRVQFYGQLTGGYAQSNERPGPVDTGGAVVAGVGLDIPLGKQKKWVIRASCSAVRTIDAGDPGTLVHCSPSFGYRLHF
jgi:hypothetical protein